jgi:hypothetical protein
MSNPEIEAGVSKGHLQKAFRLRIPLETEHGGRAMTEAVPEANERREAGRWSGEGEKIGAEIPEGRGGGVPAF